MGKIAVELERALARRALYGAPGDLTARVLASGEGWTVEDVICTSGPEDRPFEERHSDVSIAIVAAGSFQYRSTSGSTLMTPGSLMLGNTGQPFECGHQHGSGDRCLAFRYTPDYFERLAADAGVSGGSAEFRALRLPLIRALSPLVTRAIAGISGGAPVPWEEISVLLAVRAVQIASSVRGKAAAPPPAAVARAVRVVRAIEHQVGDDLSLQRLGREAGLSPYHLLRMFQRLTGVTPHQYILRTRLREAAVRLGTEPGKVIDIAFGCGFGDVSNFNRAFRAEFGVSPRGYRNASQP